MTSNEMPDKPEVNWKARWVMILAISSVVVGLVAYMVNDRKLADLKDRMANQSGAIASLEAFKAEDTQRNESRPNSPDGTSGEDRIENLNRFMIGTGDAEVIAVKSFLARVPDEKHEISFSSVNERYQDARSSVLANPPMPGGDMKSFNAATDANDRLLKAQDEVRDYIDTLLQDAKEQVEMGESSYAMWSKVSLFVVFIGAVLGVVTIFMRRKAAE